jgi:two-component system response regulator ChvI
MRGAEFLLCMKRMIRRILLIDDDVALTRVLAVALLEEGFSVEVAHDGAAGLAALERRAPDLAIVDVLLPGLDGLSLCRRTHGRVPLVILSSRTEEADRLSGFEAGADDYVGKPFSTRELVARIHAIERRLAPDVAAPLVVGALTVDRARWEVSWNGQPIELTRSELLVLHALASRRGQVLSRERLIEEARGDGVHVSDRTADTFIKRLRKKLRAYDPAFDAIETVFGVGYRYR